MKPLRSPFSALFATVMFAASLQAAPLYWDTNGTTAGSGSATGNWGTSAFWNTDSTGVAAPGAYVAGSDAVFSAGGTVGTAGTVTVTGTQSAASLTFTQPNVVTLTGGTIDFGSATGLIALQSSNPTINSLLTGTNGLNVTSSVAGGSMGIGGNNVGLSGTVNIGTLELGANNAKALGSGTIVVANGGGLHIGAGANNIVLANAIQLTGTGSGGRGALRISGGGGATGGVTLNAASTITAVNAPATISTGDVAIGTNVLTVGFVNAGALTISSNITGTTGSLSIGSPSGTPANNILTLTGAGNTFTGGVTVSAAGLALGNDTVLGSGTLTLSGGGGVNSPRIQSADASTRTIGNVLAIAGANTASILYFGNAATGPGATGTGNLIFSNTTATNIAASSIRNFQIDNASTEFRGGFTGNASITKAGTGAMLLSGVSTYTGSTTVNDGTLTLGAAGTINGTTGVTIGTTGKFDVSSKGAAGYSVKNLSGTGEVIGALSVTSQVTLGGTVAGTMTFDNLTLASTATLAYNFGGGGADLGNVDGNLVINNGILSMVPVGAYAVGEKYTLFAYTGTETGTFAGLADDSTFSQGGGTYQINYNDTTAGLNGGVGTGFVTLTVITVPEPSAALLLGGLGMLAALRRRRA